MPRRHCRPWFRTATAVLAVSVMLEGCLVRTLEVEGVVTGTISQPTSYQGRVKSHLADGSTVVYPEGVTIADGAVSGWGIRYGVGLERLDSVTSIQLADVEGFSLVSGGVDGGRSGLRTVLTAGVVAGLFVGSYFAFFSLGS